jgi:predicted nucleic acid-binding protein
VVRTGNKNVAKDISDVIRSPRIEMIIIDKAILEQADELFFKLFDKRISFIDATTMAIMQHNNIEKIITFDSHFKGMFDVMTM